MNEFLLRCNGIGTRTFLFFIGFLLSFSGWAQETTENAPEGAVTGSTTIMTDKQDYPPGGEVLITGSGYLPNELIYLQIVHEGEDPHGTDAPNHQPWEVHADVNGDIHESWIVPEDGDSLGATFILSASAVRDDGSFTYAGWKFTDGLEPPINFSGVAVSSNQINLTWTNQGNQTDDFHIERCTGNNCSTFLEIASTTNTSYSDNNVVSGTTYNYRIRSNKHNQGNHTGNGTAFSSYVISGNITTQACASGITAPTPASQTVCNNASIAQLSTTGQTGGTGSGFTYTWYNNGTTNSNNGGTLVGTGLTYNPPTSTTAGITYYYVVVNRGGCAPKVSTTISVTVNPVISFGTVASLDETICNEGDPSNIALSTSASGGAGTFNYQWYYKDGLHDCPTGTITSGWTPISSATGISYDPPSGLTTSRTYAVQVDPTGTPDCGEPTWATSCRQVKVNAAPVLAAIGNKTVDEEANLSFIASATDQDLPLQTFTYNLDDASVTAGMTIDGFTGAFSWTPTELQGGAIYPVTITVTDNGLNAGCRTHSETFNITVNEINVAPELDAIGNQSVNEEVELTFTATASDVDLPANTLTFSLSGEPAGASIDGSTGVFSWTPTEAQGYGTYTFTVKVTDDGTPHLSNEEEITVTVNEVNVAPSGANNAVITNEDTDYTFVAADFGFSDENDTPSNIFMALKVTTLPNAGSLNYNGSPVPAGGYVLVDNIGLLTFSPSENANGPSYASFTFQVQDDGGTANGGEDLDPNEKTMTIDVTAINDAPVAVDDFIATDEDAFVDINVLTNDYDVDDGDVLTIVSTGRSSDGTGCPCDGTGSPSDSTGCPSDGKVEIIEGTIKYTPNPNFNGEDSFEYTISDGNGGIATATVYVYVNSVNDAPVAEDDTADVEEDGEVEIAVLANDDDVEGDILTIFSATSPSNGTVIIKGTPGTTITYTPNPDFNGEDSFEYSIHDGNGGLATATVTITVNPVNDIPFFTMGADEIVLEDAGAQAILGWATGINVGAAFEDDQTVRFTVSNDNNALFSEQPSISSTGTLTYTPAADANGIAFVTMSIRDNGGTVNGGVDTSAEQTFKITVISVNDLPSFNKGADEAVLEDAGAQSVIGWATAISAGPADEASQTLTFTLTNDNNSLFSVQPAIASDNTLTYTFAADANGSAIVTVYLKDDGGVDEGGVDQSADQTFTITATAVNDVPSFIKGADETVLEDAGAQSVIGWATAISTGPADEASQTSTFTLTNDNNSLFSVQPAVASDGTLTYTFAADANGSATVTLNLKDDGGVDDGGVDQSADQTFKITATAVNDLPSFTKGADEIVLEDAGIQSVANWAIGISSGPSDEASQILTFTVSNDNPELFSVQPSIDANGDLTYTPAENANGVANVTVSINDNGGVANGGVDTSADQTFTITVTPVNDVHDLDNLIVRSVSSNGSILNGPILINSYVFARATITDPDLSSSYTATWDWGVKDAAGVSITTTTNSVANGVPGVYDITGSYSYNKPGVYKIVLTVSDNVNPEFDTHKIYEYVVVYDPEGGFVTGGGWIDSPVGSLASTDEKNNYNVTGKANFGFVAKYKSGKNTMGEVDGNTNFQFKEGDLNFKSTSHTATYLTIATFKATYKGFGTINGIGDFEFMVVAIDGDVNGGGGADKFRIKIWTAGQPSDVIYDNKRGKGDSDDEASTLGGGSIVIHKPKPNSKAQEDLVKGSPIIMEDLRPDILETLALSPNPVVSNSTVRFSVKEDALATLRLYDNSGRLIETLFTGAVKAFENYDVDFQRRNLMSGIYIVKLTTAKGHSYDKRIIIN